MKYYCYNLVIVSPSIIRIGGECNTNQGEEECIKDIVGKARRKETTGKTKT
jgi:hypothetical protein